MQKNPITTIEYLPRHADLKLYQYQTIGTENFMIGLHQITESWEENKITWNNQPDYLPSPESTITVSVGATTWLSWDITSLLQGWLDGSIVNYGVVLKDTDEPLGDTFIRCYSSDYITNPSLYPKLEIIYYVPQANELINEKGNKCKIEREIYKKSNFFKSSECIQQELLANFRLSVSW